QLVAHGVVPGLPSQYRNGVAPERQSVRHELATRSGAGGHWQEIPAGTQYPHGERADQLLDVSSLMDGMSDYEQKRDKFIDNRPPTAEERLLRNYPLDLAEVRAQLATKQGKQYWRTLEELADNPHFTDLLHREFPRAAAEWDE